MTRRVTYFTAGDGRDKGKVFRIEEMSAWDSEEWAGRLMFAAMNAGIDIPENIASAGLAGLATLGIAALTKMPYEAAKPLLHDMMKCVTYVPSAAKKDVFRSVEREDVDEVATLLKLRKEVLSLHLDFLRGAEGSTSESAPRQKRG